MNNIIKFINKIFRNDEITKHIAKISQTNFENIETKINNVKDNIFLDTATWCVEICEKELNLENIENKTIDERKSIIMAKWRGAGKLTLELIQNTIKAYTDNTVTVRFNGTIILDFSNKIGKPKDVNSLMQSIEDIKPAHLGIEYLFKYRTWGDLQKFNWNNIKKYNWTDVLEKENI